MPFDRVPARRLTRTALLMLVSLGGCSSSTDPAADALLDLQPVVSGLVSPVFLTAPAGDARQFVVEQPGRIRIVKNGQLLPTPFLDIATRVSSGGERGLLSMAFDPQYATNGFFYVYYTSAPNGDIVVERYGGTAGADVASATATPVITIPHPGASNHNGGLVTFGPDGMLYLGTGDGGGAGDPGYNAQNVNVLLGKLLRLDVHTLPYSIPTTNPFVGRAGARQEIWAFGLRNPWRFAFDRGTTPATLYIADVGQGAWEEIDAMPATAAGANYGWNAFEGNHCYGGSGTTCSLAGATQPPVAEYDHSAGRCSITGGFVYRGSAIPELVGQYVYSDYCAGFLASLSGTPGATFATRTWNVPSVGSVLSFGEDAAGELYVLSGSGTVYRIVRGAL
jgi:glucose/arabinose dehydrogenase